MFNHIHNSIGKATSEHESHRTNEHYSSQTWHVVARPTKRQPLFTGYFRTGWSTSKSQSDIDLHFPSTFPTLGIIISRHKRGAIIVWQFAAAQHSWTVE